MLCAMRRAIVVVLDGCGAGETPDAHEFNDFDQPSTLLHVWQASGGFEAPNLARLGYLAAGGIGDAPEGCWGRLLPLSRGKDSVTGHWEMMGIVTEEPFPTYPDGFPREVVEPFEAAIGRSVLANRPASGTRIIAELGEEHMATGQPILYTSADSVFQIAAHEEVVPIEQLYEWCRTARAQLTAPHNVQRVIARPFVGKPGDFTRTERRKDFPVAPPANLVDQIGDVFGIGVVPELFDGRGFRPVRRTQSNPQHAEMLWDALESDARFIFVNFEDFDMLYGHRNNPDGFAQCLAEFDATLGTLLKKMNEEDLLILTSDHGNDPTDPSTDHSREYSPLAIWGYGVEPEQLGDLDGLTTVGELVEEHLQLTKI